MKEKTLALFFTRGVSLSNWVESGLFEREKLIYEEHLKLGYIKNVYWFTYGVDDEKLSKMLKREGLLHESINVYDMPVVFDSKIGVIIYSFLLPFFLNKQIKQSDILKTNQMDGSCTAVLAKWLYRKKLIVRTGYTLSQLEQKINPEQKIKNHVIKLIEFFAYKNCDKAVVTSMHNKKYIIDNYNTNPEQIAVIYNFIDTASFKPLGVKRFYNRIVFVGRLNKEKNLFNLIDAISKTEFILDIYGTGVLEQDLKKFVLEKNVNVNFMGVVPNNELPEILNKYKYYILPSFFEGMPKTLLEAMASGCTCIGTNVKGINEVIENKVDGYLISGTDCGAIYSVLKRINCNYDEKISHNAYRKIQNRFSLKAVVNYELTVFCND